MRKNTFWAGMLLPLALSLAGGCANMNELLAPGGLSGLVTPQTRQRVLSEPRFPPEAGTYEAEDAHLTLDAPVELNVPDRDLACGVVCSLNDLLGTRHIPATLPCGSIVEREFGKVRDANFREPLGSEEPVATLSVRLHAAEVLQASSTGPIAVTLKIHVEVTNPEGTETAYSRKIESSASAPWTNKTLVPDAFYQAVFGAIGQFASDWPRSQGPDTVARWAAEATPGAAPPQLHDIDWMPRQRDSDVQRGTCAVVCNGWEGFRAKHWANAQIAVACRTKLGGVEPRRLRVVYDEETYDPERSIWTFAFRCFARSEKVLEYNAATGCGTVIGDLGLMEMTAEEATEVLKQYVLNEMSSHSGIVTRKSPTTEAYVRFDSFSTDETYNLVIIDFHLPR
ncbi:MAG: hypothetical protein J6Y19_08430 [Kiritimatiellae bacterium]|nr:hypothetical protein [Kiritimatiellia bacterium]